MIDTGPVLFEYQNRPYIPVRINGQGPFSFLLDTGARGLNLSDDLTDELGLEPDERYVVQVDDFSIGAASFQDLLLPLRDNVRVSQVSKRRVDGFIGSLFLSDFTLTIDYPDHSIRITDEQAEYATEPAVMRICNGYPLVAVQIQDSSVWFLVDTGTSKCIVSTELSENLQLTLGEEGLARGAVEEKEIHKSTVNSISIGGKTVSHMAVDVVDCSHVSEYAGTRVDGYIGNGFFLEFRVIIDFRKELMYIE